LKPARQAEDQVHIMCQIKDKASKY